MSDSLLYAKSIVALLVPLLTIVQLFDDVVLSDPMIATLMSFMFVVVTTYLM
jgi:hypothetical protein